jgi:hypothetical protein
MTLLDPQPLDPSSDIHRGGGLLVLGMHRSGTSATTRLLNLAGLELADAEDLWLELPGNETGYWESSSLSRFNEQLLIRAGGHWWNPPEPEAVLELAADDDLRHHARLLFDRLHPDPAWAWKDPRTCLLLPFWARVLAEPLRAVLVVRHPYEVAASLRARDAVPWAMSLALWETYVRRAVQGLAGSAVHVLSYDALLADPATTVADLVAFAASAELDVRQPSRSEVDGFLRGELRHSAFDDADLLASGRADLLELLRSVVAMSGSHEAFRPPADQTTSVTSRDTLQVIRDLSPPATLADAIAALSARPTSTTSSHADPPAEEKLVTTDQTQTPATQADSETESRDAWRTWIATNLLLDVGEAEVLAVLQQNGMEASHAAAEVATVRADPCFEAGRRVGDQLLKLESVLDVRHDLAALAPDAGTIAHHPVVTREQFLSNYYSANRPVLIEGLIDGWPALTRWGPDYMAETVPDAEIQVMVDRVADPDYEINSEQHKSTMRMADYVEAVQNSGRTNDIYMVANNHVLDQPGLAPLWDDFVVPEIYLDPATAHGSTFFWFGPGGTVTPLHHDVINVLFVQVHGSKRIILISPLETHHVYNETAVYSSVNALDPDLETYPRFARATRHELVVGPGQALFIPVGWWHCVEAVDTSISMSFTNFVFPNDYTWHHPDLRR